ncbi:VCBS repeat-containing protein [Panacibacter sp. DH6]|uniref:VCBS repeat-containing protein n=1 Tax=Panacibacter microcysteis TaxID=2793269 RepID=A0A931E5D1_9BACT|nr:VCBS repeat-containing protein [Panacibacter microcysteis]MBG9375308.1 VCBS repeat-containing protein [Panacibacter microcysteis]
MPVSCKNICALLLVYCFTGCNNKEATLFESLSSPQTNITFENRLEKKHLFSILYYLYYYNGGGVAIGDINNDNLPDIYFTANSLGNNKLYINKGNFQFEDITEKAGVKGVSDWCSGATMADVNGDGLLDIYVSTVSGKYNLRGHNELYINNGNATFTERSAEYGLSTACFTSQSVFFDYDHDGDLDCYILNQSHHPHANITDTSKRNTYDSLSGDRLYRNDLNKADKRFTEVSIVAGISQSNLGYGLGISVADINNDGWEDIYIGNDFHENDYYYVNQRNGTFREEGADHFAHYSRFSMGNDIADYNNDGQLDVVTVDMLPPQEKHLKTYGSDENADIYKAKLTANGYQQQYSRNCLQLNNGNGISFSDVALIANIPATDWSWCPLFADFDNDGNKDLFISSGIVKRPVDLDYVKFASDLKNKGMDQTDKFDEDAIDAMPDGASHPFFFKGDGKLAFSDVSKNWGTGDMHGYYNGAAYADLDNDGDLDMVINAINAPAVILKNTSVKKNYLSISFEGDSANKFGIGAKAYLFTADGLQYQQLMLTRGFQSSCDTRLHFGLNDADKIDSALIVWPDQRYEIIRDVKTNTGLKILQKNARDSFDFNFSFPPKQNITIQNISNKIDLKWQHRENDFFDFNVQYLIPHAQSTRGPKVAVGDVNNDGLQDFYVCGARDQTGTLQIQKGDGRFYNHDTVLFSRYAMCEDVDAAFFDANGDGFTDLWVVSGGNEPSTNSMAYADRLFINDGKGNFSLSGNAISPVYTNKSCISVADIDKDGDKDVFVGVLSNITQYGMPQTSYMFMNDGTGKFTVAKSGINLSNIGMVTAASFTDVNNDTWPDIIITGEWMPLKVFINAHGTFKETSIETSTGLWQTVFTTDVNGDGFTDVLAGNWGHNTKLWSGKNGPVKLYVKDFDKNGSVDQVLCYTIDGKQYTFLAKDELERAMPVLKKAYLKYDEVAGKDVQYMFFDLFKDYTELTAETLSSSCFINDGNGNFKRTDLPDGLQLAPVMAFNKTKNGFIAAGNFYGTIPYEGRYDALFPTFFSYNKPGGNFKIDETISELRIEARDLKWIRLGVKDSVKTLIIAGNNEPMQFIKINQ